MAYDFGPGYASQKMREREETDRGAESVRSSAESLKKAVAEEAKYAKPVESKQVDDSDGSDLLEGLGEKSKAEEKDSQGETK